ncbi:endonuclease/exonuclease/phosphatase family protein [Paenibacillus sp. GCM10027627]|uniref:endonuclease/exonuclease/phosphatase family protein n=1 Tax=unclassified Paenibacillus TaxID=185978 RepID=UPI0036320E8F
MTTATIMTFNLRVNTPIDGQNAWPYRKEQAAELIRNINPLIVGTQEGRYDMLHDLDQALPQYKRLGEGRAGYQSGNETLDECCAIFYRHDQVSLIKSGQFWLSERPDEPASLGWDSSYSRFCTWAFFQLTAFPQKQFYVFNTHFDHIGDQAREESAKLLLTKIADITENEGLPSILTGDFNSFPEHASIKLLKAGLQDAFEATETNPGCTFHDFAGGVQGEPIDYIFTSASLKIKETIVHRDEQEGRYPSDHYPISVLLEWSLS